MSKTGSALPRDVTEQMIKRLWAHRSDWMATNSVGAWADLDAIGVVLGVTSDEVRDLCEIGALKGEKTSYSWQVRTSDLLAWIRSFGPQWFEARTARAVEDLKQYAAAHKQRGKALDMETALRVARTAVTETMKTNEGGH